MADEGDRLNVYARLQRNEMYFEGSHRDDPTKRPFALHRNGYAGLQRYGWLWSGDTFSTWKALQAQIMVGINVGLSGIPFWGTDSGGFVPTAEYSPELFVRWFQFSTFCLSFRSHGRSWKLHLPWGWSTGTTGPKEIEGAWVADWPAEADLHRADIEEICRKYLNLRYQLLPYTYATAAQPRESGLPMIRALWLAYPYDAEALLVDDVYMWGDSFLVAPVYEKTPLSVASICPKALGGTTPPPHALRAAERSSPCPQLSTRSRSLSKPARSSPWTRSGNTPKRSETSLPPSLCTPVRTANSTSTMTMVPASNTRAGTSCVFYVSGTTELARSRLPATRKEGKVSAAHCA